MLRSLLGPASERKVRLIVTACARDRLAYHPAAAEYDGGGSIETFREAVDRVEAYVDGHGALTDSLVWVELRNFWSSALAVVGADKVIDVQDRNPLEIITVFSVNPAHWIRCIIGNPFHPVTP